MAYTLQTDEELKKKQAEDSLAGTEGVGVANKPAGESAILGDTTQTNASAPVQQASTQAPKVAGGFTDVNKYLDPNKAQTMGLANKIGGYIGKNVTGARDTMVKQRDSFGNLIDTGTNKLDEESYQDIRGYLANPNTPPTTYDQTDVEDIKKNIAGGYKGPEAWLNTEQEQATAKSLKDAQRLAGLVDTTQGRQELLGRIGTGRRVTKGALDLNAALLQRDKEAYDVLQKAKAGAEPLSKEYEDLQKALGEKITGAKDTSTKTAEQLKKEFDPNQVLTAAQQRAKEKQEEYQKAYDAYKARVEATQQAGIYGRDFLSAAKDPSQFNAATAATPEEMKKMALMQLLNNGLNPWEGQEGLAGKLPTFKEEEVFNKDAYTKAVKDQLARIAANDAQALALQNAQNQANAEMEKAKKQQQGQQTGAAVGAVAGAAIGSVVPAVGTVAGAIVGGAVGSVIGGAVGCFHPDTEVMMKEGTKKIKDIVVGDILLCGNPVSGILTFESLEPAFNYQGIIVTGQHAVKEDGKWIRVKDSKYVTQADDLELRYNLCVPGNRIFIKDVEFADWDETPFKDAFSDEENLKYLNSEN